jgi:hypothetical protein
LSTIDKGEKGVSKIDKPFQHNTRDELAKELGWSSGKVAPPSEVVLCDDRPKLKDLLVKHRPKGKRGGDRRSESFKIDNVNFEKPKTGNSRLYIEERLQRPRSSVHQQTSPNRSSKQFEVPSQERKSERLWRCVTLAGRKKRMEMLEIPTIPLATQMSIFFVA